MVVLALLVTCGTAERSARRRGDPTLVVRDFCYRFGARSGSAVASLFVDSARFDIEGIHVSFVGRRDIVRLADFGRAVHANLAAAGFAVSDDTVRCRLTEQNDWLGLLGIASASYEARFVVDGSRIASARIRFTPASSDSVGKRLAGFVAWLASEDPKALATLLPGGRPAYDSRVVPELLALLRNWQARIR
jgi:hypothetical protein